jgi:hypothetical protein
MPPNLVNAGIGIILYAELFSDPRERAALAAVVTEWKRQQAWPTHKAAQALGIADEVAETSISHEVSGI